MIQLLFTPLLHLAIFSLVILIGRIKFTTVNYPKLFLCYLLYFIFYITTYYPLLFEYKLFFPGSEWNWTGKILSIIFLLIVFSFFKKLKLYYVPKSFRIQPVFVLIIFLAFLFTSGWLFFLVDFSDVNYDTLFFQLLMPSISEELFFRSILLGLFCNEIFPSKSAVAFNIILTSLLFGFGHGIFLSNEFKITFALMDILNTFLFGVFWAWLTYNSKSVFYAMISHSSVNILKAFF